MFAREFFHDETDILEGARACARGVGERLEYGQNVVLSFEGFRGSSSSFFNTFWLTLFDQVGLEACSRLEMQTKSQLLRDLIERSRRAAVARHTSRR